MGGGGCSWFIDGEGVMDYRSYQNKNFVNVKSTQSNECIFVHSLDNS